MTEPSTELHRCAWCHKEFDYEPYLAWDWYICRPCFQELEADGEEVSMNDNKLGQREPEQQATPAVRL